MTEPAPRRAVVLLLTGPLPVAGCPPGVSPEAFAHALVEDVADLLSGLPGIEPAVACAAAVRRLAEAVTWPGTELLDLPDGAGPLAALAAAAERGYAAAAVVAPDAPDLPDLLVAKVFSGLAGAAVAAVPAVPLAGSAGSDPTAGGLVVLGSRLPVPPWLAPDAAGLDIPDAVDRLRRAAPAAADLVVTTPWRRLRTPADLAGLDPGLEGWDATRAVLSGR